MSGWISDVLARETVASVAARLGMVGRSSHFSPCPACKAERVGSGDPRGPVGAGGDGGWRCFRCDAAGDAVDLAAYALEGGRLAALPPDARARVRDWFGEGGAGARSAGASGGTRGRAEGPAEAPRAYPPPDEVAALWAACGPLSGAGGGDASLWLSQRRGLSPTVLEAFDLCRVLPDKAYPLPAWAPVWKNRAEAWSKVYRLAVPLYDATGALRSLRFRAVTEERRPTADGARFEWVPSAEPVKVKAAAPRGFEVRGLVMADPVGLALLGGELGGWDRRVVISEGEPDFWTGASRWCAPTVTPEGERRFAGFGIFNGGWTAEIAARIPSGATVYVRTDADDDGDKYAATIFATLADRCHLYRTRCPYDDNDRHTGKGPPLLGDPCRDAEHVSSPPEEKPDAMREALERCHVRTIVGHLGKVGAGARVAPLPGGWDDDARGPVIRDDAELDATARPTWPRLRRILRGWSTDTVAVLVGHTGRGKSSLAVQLAEVAACSGAPVLYASMEMGADELACRLIAMRGGKRAQWSAVKRGGYRREVVTAAGARLVADAPHLYLWAPTSRDRTMLRLEAMARAVYAATGSPPLIVLDYVQRLAPAVDGEGGQRGAVSDLSGKLRDLSRPAGDDWPGCAILALSSTGRGNYAAYATVDALLKAGDLEGSGKESGELEYDAPILLCMTSDKPEDGVSEVDPTLAREAVIRVVKNREGSGGTVRLRFEAARGRFAEWTEDQETKAKAEAKERETKAAKARETKAPHSPPSSSRYGDD